MNFVIEAYCSVSTDSCTNYVFINSNYFLPCTDTIVGVNKYTLDKEEPVEVLSIDNAKTIESQVRGIVARDTCLLAIPLANWADQQWLQKRGGPAT